MLGRRRGRPDFHAVRDAGFDEGSDACRQVQYSCHRSCHEDERSLVAAGHGPCCAQVRIFALKQLLLTVDSSNRNTSDM